MKKARTGRKIEKPGWEFEERNSIYGGGRKKKVGEAHVRKTFSSPAVLRLAVSAVAQVGGWFYERNCAHLWENVSPCTTHRSNGRKVFPRTPRNLIRLTSTNFRANFSHDFQSFFTTLSYFLVPTEPGKFKDFLSRLLLVKVKTIKRSRIDFFLLPAALIKASCSLVCSSFFFFFVRLVFSFSQQYEKISAQHFSQFHQFTMKISRFLVLTLNLSFEKFFDEKNENLLSRFSLSFYRFASFFTEESYQHR